MAQVQRIRMIPMSRISSDEDQPRKHFDIDKLEELKASIAKEGLEQPIHVRPHPTKKGFFIIVAGERRWRCCTKLEHDEMPCIVLKSDVDALTFSIVENVQRENLNPIEEALGYQRLSDQRGMTQEEIAAVVGRHQSHVCIHLALLNLPDSLQEQVALGRFGVRAGYLLVRRCSSTEEMEQVVRAIRSGGSHEFKRSYDRVTYQSIEHYLNGRDRVATRKAKSLVHVLEQDEIALGKEIGPAAKRLLGLMDGLVNAGSDVHESARLCQLMIGLMRQRQQQEFLADLREINKRTRMLLNHLGDIVSRGLRAQQGSEGHE